MGNKTKYKYFKDDFKDVCLYYKEREEEYQNLPEEKRKIRISPQKKFYDCMESYIDYVDAVVSHVIYEKDFRKYGGSIMSRDDMESRNKNRIAAHNRALDNTISLFKANPYFFLINLDGVDLYNKKGHKDFSESERTEVGELIYKVVTILSTLTPQEAKDLGFQDFSSQMKSIDNIERRNDITLRSKDQDGNMPDMDDIYYQK